MPVLAAMKDGTVQRMGTMPMHKEQPVVSVEHQLGIADGHNEQVFRLLHEHYRVLKFFDWNPRHRKKPRCFQ